MFTSSCMPKLVLLAGLRIEKVLFVEFLINILMVGHTSGMLYVIIDPYILRLCYVITSVVQTKCTS